MTHRYGDKMIDFKTRYTEVSSSLGPVIAELCTLFVKVTATDNALDRSRLVSSIADGICVAATGLRIDLIHRFAPTSMDITPILTVHGYGANIFFAGTTKDCYGVLSRNDKSKSMDFMWSTSPFSVACFKNKLVVNGCNGDIPDARQDLWSVLG